MSADNEVSVLHKNGKYYVAMIFGCPSTEEVEQSEDWHKDFVEQAIRKDNVFDTLDEALEQVERIVDEVEDEGGYVEYGTVVYEDRTGQKNENEVK